MTLREQPVFQQLYSVRASDQEHGRVIATNSLDPFKGYSRVTEVKVKANIHTQTKKLLESPADKWFDLRQGGAT